MTANLALLSPPAVVLSGDVRHETPLLRYHLGAMLIASNPELALLVGAPEAQVRAVLSALAYAFGPPGQPSDNAPNLAETLWQTLPARDQRRLRELCEVPDALDYVPAMAAARLAVRRAGLFVSGDLGTALRQVCEEDGLSLALLDSPNSAAELCNTHASARALVALGTSSEYAQTRWRAQHGGRVPERSRSSL